MGRAGGGSAVEACDVSWAAPVDGLWTDAAKWDTAAVPTAPDNVCISGAGTFRVTVREAQSAGSIQVGSSATLEIQGDVDIAAAAIVDVVDLINDGTVVLTSFDDTSSATVSVSVTFTNNGVLRSETGAGGRTLGGGGSLINNGTLDVAGPLAIVNVDVTTTGSVNVAGPPSALNLLAGSTMTVAGGTVVVAGDYVQNGGTFTHTGGALTGTLYIFDAGVSLSGSGSGGVLVLGGASTLSGTVAATQTVIVRGFGLVDAVVDVVDLVNQGTVVLTSFDDTSSATVSVSGTFTNNGVLRSETGAGGRTLGGGGSLINNGTLDVAGPLAIVGLTLRTESGQVIGGADLFLVAAVLEGPGPMEVLLHNDEGSTVGLGPVPAGMDITGSYSQASSSTLQLKLGGTVAGVDHDQFRVLGPASLDGTLEVSLVGGFSPSPGQTFAVLTYSSLTGTFAAINAPLPLGLQFVADYGPAMLTLTVESTVAAITSIAVTPVAPTIPDGGDRQFTATATFSDGHTADVTSMATWTSSAPPIATITSGGLATGLSPGTTTITATLDGISGSTTLAVTHLPSRPAVIRSSTGWRLRNTPTTGEADTTFSYGTRPLVPIFGDWDNNGSKTPGTFENGKFNLRNSNSPGPPEITFTFGDPRGFPVAGDFNGDGTDDVAVYRNGIWRIRLSTGVELVPFSFGAGVWPNTVPVAGDWDGDGTDGIGTFVAGTWSLKNAASSGAANLSFVFNPGSSPYPVVGDWDANGTDTVGVKARTGTLWQLSNSNTTPAVALSFEFGQANTDLPLSWR